MATAPSSELHESKPHNSYSMLLKSFVAQPDQTQELEDFLARLEKEWLKIEAFKRELPLCMQLLNNAMEASRQQLQTYRVNHGPKPVLEEFIPLKHSSSEGSEKTSSISEKSSWMVSAQLWSQSNDGNKQQTTPEASPNDAAGHQPLSPKLSLDDKKRNGGGAFLPFSKERKTCASPTLRILSDLALASTDDKEGDDKKCIESDKGMLNNNNNTKGSTVSGQQGKGGGNQGESQAAAAAAANSQNHRKARRCWSPDLHRRFVNALQMLGGSQVATPKQIRELMKVDGLTNDEVKSHLQKYRLHTRRPSPSHQPAGSQAPQLVVLGSIWVPPEYATAAAAHNGGPGIYGAHPASLASTHYCSPPVPQEFYPGPPHQLHHTIHHPHPHPHVVYKTTSSRTHSSPESDIQGGAGDRSESIEDGKSESGSWKGGDSGENGAERRGLASLRDEREKSSGNEITLNF